MTTALFFEEWLADVKNDIQKSTYEAYTIYFYRHIIPWFTEHANTLETLTARNIKDFINHLKTDGRIDGKGGLSSASVKKYLSLIKQALNEAVIEGYISVNPALVVKLKRTSKTVSTKAVMLDISEVNRLLKAFEGHRLYELVFITLFYGLRRSEVVGLKWSAIDFEANELRIEHTIVKSRTIEAKDTTKTDGSKATFELSEQTKKLLYDLYLKRPPNSKYVFCWDNGKEYRPDYVTRAFVKHLKKSNLKPMRFHDLRHSTASLLFDRGMSIEDVKQWLRHSDIETTSNIYLHYGRGRKKLFADKVSDIFGSSIS